MVKLDPKEHVDGEYILLNYVNKIKYKLMCNDYIEIWDLETQSVRMDKVVRISYTFKNFWKEQTKY